MFKLCSKGSRVADRSHQGLFQIKDARSGRAFPTWYFRLGVPADLRPAFDGRTKLIETTRETDHRRAAVVADRLRCQWKADFAEKRALGTGPVATLEQVLTAVDNWRRDQCAKAAGLPPPRSLRKMLSDEGPITVPGGVLSALARDYQVDLDVIPAPTPAIAPTAVTWARGYFAARPDASRSLDLPHRAGLAIGRLQVAAREVEGWVEVDGFDERLDEAASAGGLTAAIPTSVREGARQRFAAAWLEVEQHQEAERQRAAAFLAALDAAQAGPDAIRVAPASAPFQAREGDRTLGEVIDAHKAHRDERYGVLSTARKYGHLYRALEEVIGRDKPVRAVTADDARAVKELLKRVPANASKLYPDATLKEAVDLGARDGRKTLAPNSVGSYIANLSAVLSFAKGRGWVDYNVASGLAGEKRNQVKRRAFRREELDLLFGSLAPFKVDDGAKFWVAAILAYSGARANEICALRTADVRSVDGFHFIDLSCFDADSGERIDGKSLKTDSSERVIPVHPQLVEAGFLDFVQRRRDAGSERLFPELRASGERPLSHEFSKWFGRHRKSVGLTSKATVLHSFRHGFRDAGRRASLSPEVVDALGGWASPGVGARYGSGSTEALVSDYAKHMARIELSGFYLVPPPPAEDEDGRPAEAA